MIKKILILVLLMILLVTGCADKAGAINNDEMTDDIIMGNIKSDFTVTANAKEKNEKEFKIQIPFKPIELDESFKNFEKIDTAKIVEIYKEYMYENCKIICYRYSDGNNRVAYTKDDDTYYCISGDLDWTLTYRQVPSDIKEFENILGKDKGLYIEYGGGASCWAYAYYYLDDDGELKILATCDNVRYEYDIDNDGYKELITEGGMPLYNGMIDVVDEQIQQFYDVELDFIKDKLENYINNYVIDEKYLIYNPDKNCFYVEYHVKENNKTVRTETIDLYYRNGALYFTE